MATELECPACQCTYNHPLQMAACAHRMCTQCVKNWAAQVKETESRVLEDSLDLLGLTDVGLASLARGQLSFAERCAFCQGIETDHDDLVFCDRCELAVHLGCYHIPKLPPGDEPWYCEPCWDGIVQEGEEKAAGTEDRKKSRKKASSTRAPAAAAASSPPSKASSRRSKKSSAAATPPHLSARHQCCVCPNRDDRALKRVEGSSKYIHLACASFLPGPEFVDQFEATPVSHVDAIPKQWFKQPCAYCDEEGATVQCQYERCVKTYHVPCGMRHGCLFSLKDMGEEGVYKDSVCPPHRKHVREVAHRHDKKLAQKQRKATGGKGKNKGAKPKKLIIDMPCPVCRTVSQIDQNHATMGLALDQALHATTQQYRLDHPDEEDELASIIAKYSSSHAHDGESSSSSEDEAIHHRGITPAAPASISRNNSGGATRSTPVNARAKSSPKGVTSTSSTPQAAPFSPPPLTSASQTAMRAERRASGVKTAFAATPSPMSGTAPAAGASSRGPPRARGAPPVMSPSSLSRLTSPSSAAHLRAHAANSASGRKLEPRVVDFDAPPPSYAEATGATASAQATSVALPGPALRLPTRMPAVPSVAMEVDAADADDDDFLDTPPSPVLPPSMVRAQSEPANSSQPFERAPLSHGAPASRTMPSAMHRNQTASPSVPVPTESRKRPQPSSPARAPGAATVKHESRVHAFDLEVDGLEIVDHQPKRARMDVHIARAAPPAASPTAAAAAVSAPSSAGRSSKRSHNTPAPLRFQQQVLPLTTITVTRRPSAMKKRPSPAAAAPAASASSSAKKLLAHSAHVCPAAAAVDRAVSPVCLEFDESKSTTSSVPPADAPMDVDFGDAHAQDMAAGAIPAAFSDECKSSLGSPAHRSGSFVLPATPDDTDALVQSTADRETLVKLDSFAMFFRGLPSRQALTPKLLVQLHQLRVNLSHAKSLIRSGRDVDGVADLPSVVDSLADSLHLAFGHHLATAATAARKSTRNKTQTDQHIDQLMSGTIDPLLASAHGPHAAHGHGLQGHGGQTKPTDLQRARTAATCGTALSEPAAPTISSHPIDATADGAMEELDSVV